ncbi:MAG: DUF3784 domain-containing protein [Oscillospiraceae bacterium]|nr:DUF3784 domain-containing protein [Oscillospiraceae bacterium]
MANQNLLTGAVMLETMWKTRHQDLLDLVSPFVFYAVAKVCSPKEAIDQQRVLDIVRSEFGYTDMPPTIIERVFKRNPRLFQREHGQYKLNKSLDSSVSEIEKRKDDCEKKIQTLGNQLVPYLESHIRTNRKYTLDQAIAALQGFFSRQGIFLGTNQMEEHTEEIRGREEDYYIAQYLYEKRDSHAIEFDYAIDLVKGYFLQSALYLQAGNGNITTSTYRNVSFYYDTPFLLRLLGYKTSEDEKSAGELHKALEKQKGSFFYFPQTQHEIEGILNAYQRNIGHSSSVTLEGLDERKYSSSDVQRLKQTWEGKLNSAFKTFLAARPEYPKNPDGSIDDSFVINEDELGIILKKKIFWRVQESMDADMESVLGIHKLRGSVQSEEIEHCKAVFVTTNTALAKEVNKYYRRNVNADTFPLLITDSDLAALTWIKCGSVGDLPERQLLRNAYMATQPTPEVLEKFGQVLDQMQAEGKVTEEVAVAIRSSRYTKKEILFASFEGDEGIDENLILRIENKLREEYSNDAREDERHKAELQRKAENHARLENSDKQARLIAAKAMDDQLARERRIATWTGRFCVLAAIIGLIYSLVGLKSNNIFLIIALVAFAVFSVISIIDTSKGKEKIIDLWLVRRANRKHEKVFTEKQAEYRAIADGNSGKANG